MQTIQFQKDKLELIEKIIHLKNAAVLENIKQLLSSDEYELSAEQIDIVEESYAKYISGEDKGKSWEEVKSNILSKKNGPI